MKSKSLLHIFLVLFSVVIGMGCGGSDCPIITEIEEELPKYHKKTNFSNINEESVGSQLEMYIDYSGGMYPAIDQCYDFLNAIITIVDNDNTTFFHVGKGPVKKIEGDILDMQHSENPRNEKNYRDKESFLDIPIQQIVQKTDKQSLFVTDFELFRKGQVEKEAWATKEFQSWLEKGHQIDVFAKQYKKRNGQQVQYLYFLLFTPNALLTSDDALVNRLIKDGYSDRKMAVEHFSFSKGFFALNKTYKSNEEGGLNDEFYADDYFSAKNKNYEYYALSSSDVENVLEDLSKKDQYIIRGLKYMKSENVFGNPNFDIKIEDITENYLDLISSISPPASVEEEKEILTVETKDTEEDIEFIIKFNKDYQGLSSSCALYRVRINLKNADLKLNEIKMNTVLKWQDTKGFEVRALKGSLVEAMKRIKIEQELLYTYYIDLSL